jgi:putative Holliday junction resolvase
MRILGIDYGERKIGISLSDFTNTIATPLCVIDVQKTEPMNQIKKLVKEHEVDKIVVGLPINMNGTIGERADVTRGFIDQLGSVLDVEIIEWDERLSTKFSDRVLNKANVKGRKKKKDVIDKIAATFILQGYLDSLI